MVQPIRPVRLKSLALHMTDEWLKEKLEQLRKDAINPRDYFNTWTSKPEGEPDGSHSETYRSL